MRSARSSFSRRARQRFVAAARFLDALAATLMWRAFEVMRAAAIALYAVFVVLSVLAMRRGMRAGGMLLGVTVVFLLLVRTDWYDPGTKWLAAALLTAVGAGVATKRLLHSRRRAIRPIRGVRPIAARV